MHIGAVRARALVEHRVPRQGGGVLHRAPINLRLREAVIAALRERPTPIRSRPLADIGQLCDHREMPACRPSLLFFIALASCASKPVELAADRCWNVGVGDQVEGTAVLVAHKAKDGCIERGASVSGRGCPCVGFATGNDGVDRAYDRIVQSAREDGYGNVQVVVRLTGDVIPNGATGRPMIRARLLEASPRDLR